MSSSFNKEAEIYREISILRKKGQDILDDVDEALRKGKAATDPRKEFNNWLRSIEGKAWRKDEFHRCNGMCAYCGEAMREADAVVHHVEPIAKLGRKANKIENYRLVHPGCNTEIGTDIVDFLF